MSKIMVLGISGLDPQLINAWLDDLPAFKKIQSKGVWGKIQSTVPAQSPVAWTSAMSGRNPGAFGFWGYHYRTEYSYGEPNSIDCRIKDKRVKSLYQILPLNGQKIAAVNIPLTWPLPRIAGGYMISSQHPDKDESYTWPKSLETEIRKLVGPYTIDTKEDGTDYLNAESNSCRDRLIDMDAQRFKLLPYLIVHKQCDIAIAVLNGNKWISQCCYRDLTNRQHISNGEHLNQSAVHDYYIWLDKKIEHLCSLNLNDTALLVVSENSVQPLNGVLNINEWLMKEGYLVLNDIPSKPTSFEKLNINWVHTKAWSTGNNGQIYLNVRGREAQGIVEPEKSESLIQELATKITHITDDQAKPLNPQILEGAKIYTEPYGHLSPDLFIYIDEGRIKSSDAVGSNALFLSQTNIDDVCGGEGSFGYFALIGPRIPDTGEQKDLTLLDVAPTILDVMDQEIPVEMEGKSKSGIVRTPEEKKALNENKSNFLGY